MRMVLVLENLWDAVTGDDTDPGHIQKALAHIICQAFTAACCKMCGMQRLLRRRGINYPKFMKIRGFIDEFYY